MFRRAAKPAAAKPIQTETVSAASAQSAARRTEQSAQAHNMAGDEAAAVALVLSSEFADVRLLAAAHVLSHSALETVYQAMRNTDRRVAKLMQGRLDLIRHQQSELQKGQVCIDTAQRLLNEVSLTSNQVAELDRQWLGLEAPQLAASFALLRLALTQRLTQQVNVQRAMLDAVATLRSLPNAGLGASAMALAVQHVMDEHAQHLRAAEQASLPKHLLSDFNAAATLANSALQVLLQYQSAFDARQAALIQWQGVDVAELQGDLLKRAWDDLPRLPDGVLAQQLQAQFEAMLASMPTPIPTLATQRAAAPVRSAAPAREVDQHFMATLEAMEAALQQGLLQVASEHDKTLRESKGGRLTPVQSERLAHVRAEFKHLADWARWGGNVSREELVKATEELPAQQLAVTELAKKVGSLRERWKSLDTLSGSAPKVLWERFDAACALAYAPAALHFKQLADERHANAAKAEGLIAETLAASATASSDWKLVAATAQRLRQVWTRLGTIERKEKKRLDTAFSTALAGLEAPLEQQRHIEVAKREQLITEVGRLKPNERNTVDMLRALQEKWQELAKALPLERRVEQTLWQSFRTACDDVFAKRKETASAADHERRLHLQACEALCDALEAAVAAAGVTASADATLLRETKRAWQTVGPVPRAQEQKIAQRYQAACAALQQRIDGAAQRADAAQASALRDKLRLCQALEQALVSGEQRNEDWSARWLALPALIGVYERSLATRFGAALQQLQEPAGAYAAELEANRSALQLEVLRLEIVAGVDSGAEFARERLKMQVDVLQSSLKLGQTVSSPATQLQQLCGIAALADARTVSRIDILLRRMGGGAAGA